MFLARRHKPPKLRQKIMPPIDNGTGQACPNEIGAVSLSFNRKEQVSGLRWIPFAVEVWASQSLRRFWIAVAERSGDTAFRLRIELPRRRGSRSAGFPPQSKTIWLRLGRALFSVVDSGFGVSLRAQLEILVPPFRA